MTVTDDIRALIKQELEQNGPCTLETLARKLPTCGWNQVFMVIDSLSREGAITLQPYTRSQYLVSLTPMHQYAMDFDASRERSGSLVGQSQFI
jgi:hypothetical protein